jgi:hypothetical protein
MLRIRSAPTTMLLSAGHEEVCVFWGRIRSIPLMKSMRPPR